MSLLEITLEKPAYKRITKSDGDDADASDSETVGAPSTDADDSGRRPTIGAVALLTAIVAVLAIRWRRS